MARCWVGNDRGLLSIWGLALALTAGCGDEPSTAASPMDVLPPPAAPGAMMPPAAGAGAVGDPAQRPATMQPAPSVPMQMPPPSTEPAPPPAMMPPQMPVTPEPEEPAQPPAGEWRELISGDWMLPPETEGYRCVRQTLQEDIYISGLQAISPPGTHHTVLGVGSSAGAGGAGGPDGAFDCSASVLGQKMVFGSGVGTGEYNLPEGVALRLRAGEQLLLNLHLFNAGQQAISGTSGTRIKTVDAAAVQQVADNVLAGSTTLNIPPGLVNQQGSCTMTHDATLISVFPHMHQLGVHLSATAHSSVAGDVLLHDAPYDFDAQTIYPIEEVQMRAGDKVSIDCQYQNDTDRTVRFGDSSLAEMCFLGLFRYPAAADSSFFICTR